MTQCAANIWQLIRIRNETKRVNLCDLVLKAVAPEAVALVWCYGLGKVVASKKDMEAFMQSPTPQAEARMLHFSPAVHGRSTGIQLRDEIAQNLCIQFIEAIAFK